MELRHGEFYWIHAIALSETAPLMVARWDAGVGCRQEVPRWWIGHQWFRAGPGIDPISRIPKPTEKENQR